MIKIKKQIQFYILGAGFLTLTNPAHSMNEPLTVNHILPILYGALDPSSDGDYDNDGLTNGEERTFGSNYRLTDTDGDGLDDNQEFNFGSNPKKTDSDNDGLSDIEEYYYGSLPQEPDSDNDGINDLVELNLGSDPNRQDMDNDGVLDGADNCIDFPNNNQTDTNNDGIGNACQCGDTNNDGTLTVDDAALISTDTNNLSLAALSRCDVNADGICNLSDSNLLRAHLAAPDQNPILTSCPTLAQKYDRVLSRLGYGPNQWTRNRIRDLGIHAYIEEQLSPNTIDDSNLNNRLTAYADESQYPSLGKSAVWLKSHYCSMDNDNYCYEQLDSNSRVWGNQAEIKFLRSVYSNRQLHQVLLDMWFNHFNVFSQGGNSIWTLPQYEKAIENQMYGSFEEMIKTVTFEPSMMSYLNLSTSKSPTPNENYARELMELHTIGPNNYPDNSVSVVAQIISGYTYKNYGNTNQLQTPPSFEDGDFFQPGTYNNGRHVSGTKTVTIAGNDLTFAKNGALSDPANATCNGLEATEGDNESQVLLCILAREPSSARMIARKIIYRFIGDHAFNDSDVSEAIIAQVQANWTNNNGNLKTALETVLTAAASNENGSYFERSLYLEDNKVKRPLYFSASIVRALGEGVEGESTYQIPRDGSSTNRRASFNQIMGDMEDSGDPLYRIGPPTGYSEASDGWLDNTAVLIKIKQAERLINAVPSPLRTWGLGENTISDELLIKRLSSKIMPGGSLDLASSKALASHLSTISGSENKVREAALIMLLSPRSLTH